MRSPIVVFTIAAAVAIGPALVSGLPASPGGPGADLAVPASEVSKHEPSDGRIPSIHRRQDLVGALGGIGDVNKATGPGDQGDDSESHHNTSSHEEAEPNFGEGRDRHGRHDK